MARSGPLSDSQAAGAAWLRDIRLVVLDRDGVLNRRRLLLVRRPRQLDLLPGVGDALATMKDLGLKLHVATNQPHAAWGWIRDLPAIHARLEELVAPFGVRFDGIHACTHTVFARCACRKPRPGMMLAAMQAAGVGGRETLMVGAIRGRPGLAATDAHPGAGRRSARGASRGAAAGSEEA